MTTDDKDPLEDFFEAARKETPALHADLSTRILSDAEDILTARDAAQTETSGFSFRRGLHLLGGWPTLAGLATATAAGLWIGISPPAVFEPYLGVQTVEYLPGFDALLEEG